MSKNVGNVVCAVLIIIIVALFCANYTMQNRLEKQIETITTQNVSAMDNRMAIIDKQTLKIDNLKNLVEQYQKLDKLVIHSK